MKLMIRLRFTDAAICAALGRNCACPGGVRLVIASRLAWMWVIRFGTSAE